MTRIPNRPVLLMILDGYGYSPKTEGNAVALARRPNLDRIVAAWPSSLLNTSGMDVGLPRGQMGNSEVGHTNIGAGRVVYQELTRITKEIEEGGFFLKKEFLDAIAAAKAGGGKLHFFGLLSDGGVHSHDTHLHALLRLAKQEGMAGRTFVHAFFDGRDVPPDSALGFTKALVAKMGEIGCGRIATLMGRYYAMDRDNRWDRVQKAYAAMALGEGVEAADPVQAVVDSYEAGVQDEFVLPTVVKEGGRPVATIDDGDSVVFFNFRPDRAREITRAFLQPGFDGFPRAAGHTPGRYVCMTQYDRTFASYPGLSFAYLPENLDRTFGEVVGDLGLRQLRIAETEKYAHVTFFFNGGVEKEVAGEDRCLVPSPKVATYEMKPEMSAYEVADEAVKRIEAGTYDVIVLNFANCDMVGHTGFLDAAVQAVEAVDACAGKVVDAVLAQGGVVLLTADHGNAEQMIDPASGGPFTAHTTNPVPLVVTGLPGVGLKNGRLADLAPTMLDAMGIPKPAEMTGESLLVR